MTYGRIPSVINPSTINRGVTWGIPASRTTTVCAHATFLVPRSSLRARVQWGGGRVGPRRQGRMKCEEKKEKERGKGEE